MGPFADSRKWFELHPRRLRRRLRLRRQLEVGPHLHRNGVDEEAQGAGAGGLRARQARAYLCHGLPHLHAWRGLVSLALALDLALSRGRRGGCVGVLLDCLDQRQVASLEGGELAGREDTAQPRQELLAACGGGGVGCGRGGERGR